MPLSHLRAMETGSGAADVYCVRLFTGLDASVMKTEQSYRGLRRAASFVQMSGVAAKSSVLCSESRAFGDKSRDVSKFERVADEDPIGSEMPMEERWGRVPKKAAR